MFYLFNRAVIEMMDTLNNNINMANNRINNNARVANNNRANARVANNATKHTGAHCNCAACNNARIATNNRNNANAVKNAPKNAPKIPAAVAQPNANAAAPVKVKKIKKEFISKAQLLEPIIDQILVPSKKEDIRVGSLIYAKYKGKYIQHKVAAVDPKKGYQVTRKGHVNGWIKNVCSRIPNVKIVEKTDVADIAVNQK